LSEMLAVRKSALGWEIRLFQLHVFGRVGFLDRDETLVVLVHRVAGEADHPLHERAAFAALVGDPLRRVEDDDVAAGRRSEVEADAAREHAVARVAEAAGIRGALRAVQRRLHGGGRDPVRVHDPLLERDHDQDRAGDGEDPVERDPDSARQAGKEAGERVAAVPGGIPLVLGVVAEQVVSALVSVVPVVAVIRPLPLPRRVVGVGPLPRRARDRPAARRLVALPRLVVVGPVAPEVAGFRLVLGPAARLLATGAPLVLLVLVVELAAVAPVVAHRTCSRRQVSTRAWWPDSGTSGTG